MSDPPLTTNGWLRWDLGRRLLAGLADVESLLEIGAGGGALGVRLARRFRYVGLELDERSFALAERRFARAGLGTILHGDLTALPGGAAFDLVCAFEVLEHFEDDTATLASWLPVLHSRGWLLLSVPAFTRKLGPWDAKAGHYRRYEREQLAGTLRSAGFDPVAIQAFGFPLGNVLEAARNVVARSERNRTDSFEQRTAQSGRLLQPPERLGAVTRALSLPGRLLQRPFVATDRGTGFVALARRAT
jgi:SAM-dependent methyltransferase